jgi:hypothetical protein
MKAFRKVSAPSLERNKVKVKDVLAKAKADREEKEGLWKAVEENEENEWDRDLKMDEEMDESDDFGIGDSDSIIGDSASVCSYNTVSTEKPRLNIAEKKKLKKQGMTNDQIRKLALRKAFTNKLISENTRGVNASGISMGLLEGLELDGGAGSSFKDSKFFMSYGNEDDKKRMQEDLMQPQSGLRDLEMQSKIKR